MPPKKARIPCYSPFSDPFRPHKVYGVILYFKLRQIFDKLAELRVTESLDVEIGQLGAELLFQLAEVIALRAVRADDSRQCPLHAFKVSRLGFERDKDAAAHLTEAEAVEVLQELRKL